MGRKEREIRDPIHVFIRLSDEESRVLDSRPFQRLRHVHQLALTYLVYPGATHRRFEHSLGVMELAGRVYDSVTRNVPAAVDVLPGELAYWRKALRMAALCHDIGHLPFSHAAEKELLPSGWTHESLTVMVICSEEMSKIWRDLNLQTAHVLKLALGPKEMDQVRRHSTLLNAIPAEDLEFRPYETIFSEIIVGDAFGVDRMDYLLRDSFHAGVAYGRFDHYRLIDTLRILPYESAGERQFALGVEEGGLQSAEALMMARYFMYSQVYMHPVRMVYDLHLRDFMKTWLPGGRYPTEMEGHLSCTDTEVLAAMRAAISNPASPLHPLARRILERGHFRRAYSVTRDDIEKNPEAGEQLARTLRERLGADAVLWSPYRQKGAPPDFPVQDRNGRVVSSLETSAVLQNLPLVSIGHVFVEKSKMAEAQICIKETMESKMTQTGGADGRQ